MQIIKAWDALMIANARNIKNLDSEPRVPGGAAVRKLIDEKKKAKKDSEQS